MTGGSRAIATLQPCLQIYNARNSLLFQLVSYRGKHELQSYVHYIMHTNYKKPFYKSGFAICILAKMLPRGSATELEMTFPHCIFITCYFFCRGVL